MVTPRAFVSVQDLTFESFFGAWPRGGTGCRAGARWFGVRVEQKGDLWSARSKEQKNRLADGECNRLSSFLNQRTNFWTTFLHSWKILIKVYYVWYINYFLGVLSCR